MAACVYPISLLSLSDLPTLLIQVPLGVAIYVLGSRLLKLDSFDYLLSVVRRMISKNKAG